MEVLVSAHLRDTSSNFVHCSSDCATHRNDYSVSVDQMFPNADSMKTQSAFQDSLYYLINGLEL